MSDPKAELETVRNKPAVAVRLGTTSFTKWVVCAGALVALVGLLCSPTLATFLSLGGALLLLGAISVLPRLASKVRGFSASVHPGVVVMVTTVCLGLLLIELVLRLVFFQSFPDYVRANETMSQGLGYQFDRVLGWSPVPNLHRTTYGNRRILQVVNNSKGFRDAEPLLDARPGILFLGDSFVWGYNVEATERFTEKLRARHQDWQVYNVGVVGYGTDQEYLSLQQHFQQYHPRIVFLIFCAENDRLDNCSNGAGGLAFKPYFTVGPKGLQLQGVPVPRSDCLFCLQHPLLSKPYLIRLFMRAWQNLHSPRPRPGMDPTIAILEAMRQFVADHGAVFCVGLTRNESEIERFLQSSGIPSLDLGSAPRGFGDFHWGPEGHTFAADKIEQFLISGKFLP